MCSSVDRNSASDFQFNPETEFVPILGLVEKQLNSIDSGSKEKPKATSIQDNHHPALLSLLADELTVAPESIHDFELLAPLSISSDIRNGDELPLGTYMTYNHLSWVG